MKHTLLFLLLLCNASFGVERPKGFLGINWGGSPEEAKRVMQARPGVKFPEGTDDYKFELTGGTFAGQTVAKWTLEFPERKFASAIIVLKNEGNASTLYKDFRTQFATKYGPATSDKKLIPPGEKRPMVAQPGAEKKGSFGGVTTWKFEPNMKEKSNVTISCQLAGANGAPATDEAQLVLTIHYINDTLAGTAPKNASAPAKPSQSNVKKEDL